MGHRPKISIITPSFNQGHYIEETIRSVLEQSYRNIEYIIMDGGSTDATVSIIERYADRISYWISEPDGGQSEALKRGFERATGDILAWINSDDCLAPGALEAIASAFESGPVDIVAGIVNVETAGKLVYHHRTGVSAGPLALEDIVNLEAEWLRGRFFYQPEVYFSREIYRAAGNTIDTSLHYSMDYDLWARMAGAKARILPIDYQVANFRIHPDQKTNSTAAYLPELTRHANRFRSQLGMEDITPTDPALAAPRRPLRVGMLNDHGFKYGAGRAHRRIAECLAAHQVEVSYLAFCDGLDKIQPVDVAEAAEALKAAGVDIIIVGNLHGAFPRGVSLEALAAVAPVLLVTHDFFWLTGRCAYPMACDAYLFKCPPTCPTRESYPVIPADDIPQAHQTKIDNLKLDNVYFLANSDYLATSVRRYLAIKAPSLSPASKVRRLHLAVPEENYRLGDRQAARDHLGLVAEDFVVLCSASSVDDPRKGFKHILEACRLVGDARLRIVAMGQVEDGRKLDGVTYVGFLEDDEAIAECYRASDVFVSGSSNETFGQTFVEAAMCGCPSIGYASAGISEAIIADKTGWLVAANDIAAIVDRLRVLLSQTQVERDAFRTSAHVHATSRYGAASLLAGLDDVFRDLVLDPNVEISKSVQYGGVRSLPIDGLPRRRILLNTGFAEPEGPFPHLGIDEPIAWQTSPLGEITLITLAPGPHLLTLRLGTIIDGQTVTISLRGEQIAQFQLPVEAWTVRTEVDLAIHLDLKTTLTIEVERAFIEPGTDRSLYVAFSPGRLVTTETADGLRPIRRVGMLDTAHNPVEYPAAPKRAMFGGLFAALGRMVSRQRADNYSKPIPPPPPPPIPLKNYLQPSLAIVNGFSAIEGPYPTLGINSRLAWQTSADADIEISHPDTETKGEGVSLTIDLVLPCKQSLTVRVGATVVRFEGLAQSSWTSPTRLVVNLESLADNGTSIHLHAEENIVDDANRTLFSALLGALVFDDFEAATSAKNPYADFELVLTRPSEAYPSEAFASEAQTSEIHASEIHASEPSDLS